MVLIACVDERMGMMFNNRRQSSDSVVRERILQLSVKASLWMNSYSEDLFEDYTASHLNVSEMFMSEAENEDFCFAENPDDIYGYENEIDMIILYNWNKAYPCDKEFPIDLNNWVKVETTEFEGNSHKVITEEIYVRG